MIDVVVVVVDDDCDDDGVVIDDDTSLVLLLPIDVPSKIVVVVDNDDDDDDIILIDVVEILDHLMGIIGWWYFLILSWSLWYTEFGEPGTEYDVVALVSCVRRIGLL